MELYSSIRKGDFEPDGDRSGRWAEDREQALKNPEISESDSSDTESGKSSDGEIVAGFTDSLHRSKSGAQGEEVIPGTSRAEFPGCEIYKHVKTHFFHVGAEVASAGHSAKMRCGRRSRFFALVSEEAVVLPTCATCFRDQGRQTLIRCPLCKELWQREHWLRKPQACAWEVAIAMLPKRGSVSGGRNNRPAAGN
jgi:hypothetical protein